MSSLINRLFQKSDRPIAEAMSPSRNRCSDFLKYFYSKGFKSEKLNALKTRIKGLSLSLENSQHLYILVKSYLEIEHYLTRQDPGFLGNVEALRTELNISFPAIRSTKQFSVLYDEGNTQEITLGLLLTEYLYELASEYCGYIAVLSPEYKIIRDIEVEEIDGNIVYYLSCKRKIKEYIEKLSLELDHHCEEKNQKNPFNQWKLDFLNYYNLLRISRQLPEYFTTDAISPLNNTINAVKSNTKTNTSVTKKTSTLREDSLELHNKRQHLINGATAKNDQVSMYSSALENMQDKAIIFDRSGKLLFANECARRFFNIGKNDVAHRNIYKILPLPIVEELQADINDHLHKRERTIFGKKREIQLERKDGLFGYYEMATSNNYTEGEDTYSIFLRDITKKKDTLDTMSKEMEHVQRAAKAKSTFLSNMSHEIRTPLNVILGLSDIVRKSDNTNAELFKKNIDGIDFSAKSLLSIVNDILDFSKIEAEKLSIQSYDYNLRKVITQLTDGFRTKAQEKGVALYTDIQEAIPDIVIGDQYRLNQILTNLIGNAIKFTNEGEVTITVKHKELSEDKIETYFQVKDSGIGIPADKLEHIFDSFYQIETAGHSKSNGTGLGLAITKELINLQDGTLTATSVAGEGSCFSFTLPMLKSKLQSTEETKQTHHSRKDEQLAGLRVLVADDNTMNQFYIKQLLNRLEIEVDIAENGQEAVDIYNSQQRGYYDLILMDMHMPVLGGVGAIKKIRNSQQGAHKRVPIVVCSADVFPESRKDAIKAGIDFYLTKPVDEDALKEVLFWLVSDEELDISTSFAPKEESRRSTVDIKSLSETFDNDDEFIITLLDTFISDTPDDYKSLVTCMEREYYSRASELAHKMKSSFMNLGMTHQGYFLQQIEQNINSSAGLERGKKYFEQFKNLYTRSLLDVNIQLIELKRF